jgi:DNA-binding protein H-NS
LLSQEAKKIQRRLNMDLNLEKQTLEELTRIQKEIVIEMEKRVAKEMRQLRDQFQNMAKTMGFEVVPKGGAFPAEKPGREKAHGTYRHPEDATLVWNGEGRKPKWVRDILKQGRDLESFRVEEGEPETLEAKPEEKKRPEEFELTQDYIAPMTQERP